VNKDLIVPRSSDERLLEPTSLIRDAREAGLLVHAWTFRSENTFLPADFRAGNPGRAGSPERERYLRTAGDAPAEYQLFFRLGIDGVFADHPDTAIASRHAAGRAAAQDQ
jgi:glycerophosphoryl diester phosphodiesterase